MRPPTAKLTSSRSVVSWKAPETRSEMASSPVWSTPVGVTTFCACSAAVSAAGAMPSPASSSIANSM